MKTRKVMIALMTMLVLLFQIVLPITSIATETTKTIAFNDKKLYEAIKDILGDKIQNYNDTQKAIVISNSNLEKITTLELKNKGIKDISGLENFSKLQRLEVSGNELTSESNLEKLLELEEILLIDLSTNKIDSLEKIESLYEEGKLIVTNQVINHLEIIKVDDEAKQTAANIGMPKILDYLEENEYNKFELKSDNEQLKPKNFDVNTSRLQVGKIDDTNYTMFSGKLDADTTVKSGEFNGSIIKLTYLVISKDCEGIMFKDENLYKAIKEQLTKGQYINEELNSFGEEGITLYEKAYDEELILVIKEDVLNNDITSLLLENNAIKDLTGIEYFRAIETLDLSKNYISDVSKILELQNSKAELRQEMINKLGEIKSELAQLNSAITSVDEQGKTNETSIKSKRDIISGIIADYIRGNNNNTITDEKIKSIQDVVAEISVADISDEGECTIITTIEDASGVYTKDGDKLKKELKELKDLLKKPEELSKQKDEKIKELKDKCLEFIESYSRAAELISIISEETMELDLDKIDGNNMTNEEIKSTFAKLKELELKEISALESMVEELLPQEMEWFLKVDNVEDAKEEIENLKKTMEKLPETVASIEKLKNDLGNIIETQKVLNSLDLGEFIATEDDAVILKLAKRLEKANLEKVKVDYLKTLDLGYNNIDSLEIVKQIPELKELHLNNNLIIDLNGIQGSEIEKSIEILNLANNEYIDNASYLQNFKNLRGLSLAGNSISDISQLDYSKLEKLEFLNLSGNRISDFKDIIKQLKKLEAFKADDKSMPNAKTANQKIAEGLHLENQYITMDVEVAQTDDKKSTIELPKIFAQAEEFEPKEVYFENATVQEGIATITVPTLEIGENTKSVSIYGGIADGTTCTINYKVSKAVENVTLNESSIQMLVEEEKVLVATVTPENATNKNVTWSTSDETIATVENGKVTAVSEGTATITVTTEDGGKVARCEVTVEKAKLDKIEVKTNPNKVDYKVGEELTTEGLVLTATYTDASAEEISEGFACEPTTFNTVGTQEIRVSYTKDEITKETTFSVTVEAVEEPQPEQPEEPEQLEIVTDYEIEENYVEGVNPKTTISNFVENIVTNGEVKILKDGTEVTEGNIGTGMTIEVTLNDQKETYVIVVNGDCTGDGEVDFTDILQVNKYRLKGVQMEGEYLRAGDINDDGAADFTDILQINKIRKNK